MSGTGVVFPSPRCGPRYENIVLVGDEETGRNKIQVEARLHQPRKHMTIVPCTAMPGVLTWDISNWENSRHHCACLCNPCSGGLTESRKKHIKKKKKKKKKKKEKESNLATSM